MDTIESIKTVLSRNPYAPFRELGVTGIENLVIGKRYRRFHVALPQCEFMCGMDPDFPHKHSKSSYAEKQAELIYVGTGADMPPSLHDRDQEFNLYRDSPETVLVLRTFGTPANPSIRLDTTHVADAGVAPYGRQKWWNPTNFLVPVEEIRAAGLVVPTRPHRYLDSELTPYDFSR